MVRRTLLVALLACAKTGVFIFVVIVLGKPGDVHALEVFQSGLTIEAAHCVIDTVEVRQVVDKVGFFFLCDW